MGHFDALAFCDAGHLAVVASALTGRTWGGSIHVISPAPTKESAGVIDASVTAPAVHGMADAAWISSDILATACDDGGLRLHKVSFGKIDEVAAVVEHHDIVTALAFSSTSVIATSSSDASVKLWSLDNGELRSLRTLKGHCDAVHALSWDPLQPGLLVSVSRDGAIILWDDRQPSFVHRTASCDVMPTSVVCHSRGSLIVGHATGTVSVCDLRQWCTSVAAEAGEGRERGAPTANLQPHTGSVRRMVAVGVNSIATCGDDGAVFITDLSNATQEYQDRRHTDFVRGLAVDTSGKLWSAGWDGRLLQHEQGSP